MSKIVTNIFAERCWHFWLKSIAWGLIVIYLCGVPYAAKKGGDFVHLWIGGHLVAQTKITQLYEPTQQLAIIKTNQLPLEKYWGARYELLGVFFYPPFTALLYAPLGALSLYWAQAVQAILNIGLGLCSAWLLMQIVERRLSFSTIFVLLFTFPSFFYAYVLGQNGILTMTLMLVSYYTWQRQRPWWAGVLFSLLAYKPNWLLAVGWIPIVQRRWRLVLGIGCGLLLLLIFTLPSMGIASIQAYLALFAKLTDLHDLPNYPLWTQYSMLSLYRRYLGLDLAATVLGWSSALLIVAATAWYLQPVRTTAQRAQRSPLLPTALAWVAAVCLNPHLHHYDLLLLSAAMIIALSEWQDLRRAERYWLGGLLLFHQCAFVLTDTFTLNQILPLPIFAMLTLWGWLLFRVRATSVQSLPSLEYEARVIEPSTVFPKLVSPT